MHTPVHTIHRRNRNMIIYPRQADADNGARRPQERDALLVGAFDAGDDHHGVRSESVAGEFFDAFLGLRWVFVSLSNSVAGWLAS